MHLRLRTCKASNIITQALLSLTLYCGLICPAQALDGSQYLNTQTNYPNSIGIQGSSSTYLEKLHNWALEYKNAQGNLQQMLPWDVYFSLNQDAAIAWETLLTCTHQDKDMALRAYATGSQNCPEARKLIVDLHRNVFNFSISSKMYWGYLRWQLSKDLVYEIRTKFPSHILFHNAVFAHLSNFKDRSDQGTEEQIKKMISMNEISNQKEAQTFVNLNILFALTKTNLDCTNPIRQSWQAITELFPDIRSFQFLYGFSTIASPTSSLKCQIDNELVLEEILNLEKIY